MPELPEVETTARGIRPHIEGRTIVGAEVRQRSLRQPVTRGLPGRVAGRRVRAVTRRGKYLLLDLGDGHLLVHLGMTGGLRVLRDPPAPGRHDHLDLVFDDGRVLRYHDPRRFGLVLHTRDQPAAHPLIRELGPEPLGDGFDGAQLQQLARGRRVAVKAFIMDGKMVVGVGNIYASEALFRAGIHPRRPAGRIALPRYELLATTIREVLSEAIRAGGTTLRDFTRADGSAGYFKQELLVYDRDGEPCFGCDGRIRSEVIGQRMSYFCPECQR